MLGMVGLLSEPVACSQLVDKKFFLFGGLHGIIRGTFGGAFKPLVGLLRTLGTVTGRLAEAVAINRVSDVNEKKWINEKRSRAPRFLKKEGRLNVYRGGENVGKEMLSRVKGGLYLSEGHAVFFGGVSGGNMAALLSKKRIMLVHEGDERFCDLEWEVLFGDVAYVDVEGGGNGDGDEGKEWGNIRIWHVDKDEMRRGRSGEEVSDGWEKLINHTSGLTLLSKKIGINDENRRATFLALLKEALPKSVLF